MEALIRDLQYALRTMRRAPAASLVSILTLALGISGTTLLFGIVQAVLLAPLPFAEPDRLVQLWQIDPARPGERLRVTPDNLADWRAQARSFEQLAYLPDFVGASEANLVGADANERVAVAYVSANYFQTLRVTPQAGRTFEPREDEQERHPPTAIVSRAFWRSHLDADPAVLGRTITLDTYWKRTFTIVGVMPDSFDLPRGTDIWLPMGQSEVGITGSARAGRCCAWLQVIGRLGPGVSIDSAQREMDLIAARLAAAYPAVDFGRGVQLVPLREQTVGAARPALLALFGAAACVLLIACVNLAHLALARAAGRRQEMGLRIALGASRWRLVRQLSAESLLLGAIGGLLGTLCAAWALQLAPALLADRVPRADQIQLQPIVILFSVAVTLLTTMLVGVAPAWWSSGVRPHEALLLAGRANTAAPGHTRLRGALVIAEMAGGLMLLAGALLLANSLVRLLQVDRGFDSHRALVLELDFTSTAFDDQVRPQDVVDRIRERLRARPDVREVTGTLDTPLASHATGYGTAITIEGQPFRTAAESPRVDRTAVMPDYFRTLGMPLLQGRTFTADDRDGRPEVAIVNEAMAARYWPGRSAIGKRFTTLSREDLERQQIQSGGRARPTWVEIVGIVRDARTRALDAPARPAMFMSYRQFPWNNAQLIVRTRGEASPETLGASLRAEICALDRHIVVSRVRSLDEIVQASVARPRIGAMVAGLFAAIGLALAALGLYGVMAHGVAARTREMGVRMALGARPADVRRLVLAQGLRLTGAGLLLGLAGVALLTQVLRGLLYAISPLDPVTLCAASAALAAVALLAAMGPARRAAALDPLAAIRDE